MTYLFLFALLLIFILAMLIIVNIAKLQDHVNVLNHTLNSIESGLNEFYEASCARSITVDKLIRDSIDTVNESIKNVGNGTTQNIAKVNEEIKNEIEILNHDVMAALSIIKTTIVTNRVTIKNCSDDVLKKIEAKNSSINRIIKNYPSVLQQAKIKAKES